MRTYIDKVALIYLQNRKVLMVMSKDKDLWFIPGGKREGNETDKETLQREVKEELGVGLNLESIRYYGVFEAQAHGKPEGTFVRILCYIATFSGEPKADGEIGEIGYLSYDDKHRASAVDHLIFDDLKIKGLIS